MCSGQADTVRGGVRHHAAVVAAASTAGHPGFLLEVQSEAASQPRLLHLCLNLETGGGQRQNLRILPQ